MNSPINDSLAGALPCEKTLQNHSKGCPACGSHLRQALNPWQETQSVQGLDSQMEQFSFLRRRDSEEMSQ